MLQLRVVQARYGDCLILENHSGKRTKYILMDGGPAQVYRPHLRGELQRITAEGSRLELAVLSHIDNDHVIGLLDLMRDIKAARYVKQADVVQIAGMWHNAYGAIVPDAGTDLDSMEWGLAVNPPDDEPPGEVSYGVGEGEKLELAGKLFSIPRNAGFPDGLITLETAPRPVRVGGVKLWILGPLQANLAELRQKWLAWLAQQKGPVSFGVEDQAIKPDESVNNLSSIMFLAEAGGRRILMTGDGRSADILTGLESTGLLKPGGTIRVDILKVPHHGSARNCVGELFDRVLADTYILSADGHYDNPDAQTLDWLVEAACRQDRVINIFATNWTGPLRDLAARKDSSSEHFKLTVMDQGVSSVVL